MYHCGQLEEKRLSSIHKSDQQKTDGRLEVREQQESDSAACMSWNIHPGCMVINSAPVPTHLPWVTKIECRNRKGPGKSDNECHQRQGKSGHVTRDRRITA